jgi:hypothetical protein
MMRHYRAIVYDALVLVQRLIPGYRPMYSIPHLQPYDQFGAFGLQPRPVTPANVPGLMLMLTGVILNYWKLL